MTNSHDPASPRDKVRAVPRHEFVATSQLRDPVNGVRLSGRVTEMSRSGCYVDTLHPFPAGTLMELEISCDQGVFSTKARIVYVHAGIGMGVEFLDSTDEQLNTLGTWLAGLPSTAAL